MLGSNMKKQCSLPISHNSLEWVSSCTQIFFSIAHINDMYSVVRQTRKQISQLTFKMFADLKFAEYPVNALANMFR